MREIDHPPDAPALLESMRSMGYSVESALADLIDNSISAKASQIEIDFRPAPAPYVALIDDGCGMSSAELERAMRHGSTNPLTERTPEDLGRYGLGLKTASLSQCRRLTVASIKGGKLSALRWDLDRVIKNGAWTLLELDREDIESLPIVENLRKLRSGTAVVWQELDRLAAGYTNLEDAIAHEMARSRNHLALVFHRYIAGESRLKKLRVIVNGSELEGLDPFLEHHRATQRLEEDSFAVHGSRVSVKPFILPHVSKLKADEVELAGGQEGIRHQQGFYVYRNRRLIVWGTWFGLARKDELSKLARVRVDTTNRLDHLWTVDVKKSVAVPPEAVRRNLRRTIERIRDASGRTLSFRGRQARLGLLTPCWSEVSDREGVRFDINRMHPGVQAFSNGLSQAMKAQFENVLRLLESSFPADALYARLASDRRHRDATELTEAALLSMAEAILEGWSTHDPARSKFLASLALIEPFSARPEVAAQIVQTLMRRDHRRESQ